MIDLAPFEIPLTYLLPTSPNTTPVGGHRARISAYLLDKPLDKTIPTVWYRHNGRITAIDDWVLDKATCRHINTHGIHFYLMEPLCSNAAGAQFNRGFYSEFTDNVNDLRSAELDSISEFLNRNSLTHATVFTCDYGIQQYYNHYSNLTLECHDLFLRMSVPRLGKPLTKRIKYTFFCANWRYTNSRAIITGLLANYNSKLGWYFSVDPNILTDVNWYIPNALVEKGINKLNSVVPMTLDINTNSVVPVTSADTCYYPVTELHADNPAVTNSTSDALQQYYAQCFVDVVNETRFAQPTGNFSEKIYHSAQYLTPFILVAPPYTLQYAKTFGFKSFSQWWDESYDIEEDHGKRLNKIAAVIQQLSTKTIDQLNSMYAEMQSVLVHNRNIVDRMQQRTVNASTIQHQNLSNSNSSADK